MFYLLVPPKNLKMAALNIKFKKDHKNSGWKTVQTV